jgi:poly(U)-binding-splicing factor PUF60
MVRSVTLGIDTASQRHKGYAFLEFEVPEGAYLSVEKMNAGTAIGRQMKIGRPSNFPSELPAGCCH